MIGATIDNENLTFGRVPVLLGAGSALASRRVYCRPVYSSWHDASRESGKNPSGWVALWVGLSGRENAPLPSPYGFQPFMSERVRRAVFPPRNPSPMH